MAEIEKNKTSFEAMLKELHAIVTDMENGGTELNSIVSNYKRGVDLLTNCRNKLAQAEISISELTEKLENTENQNIDSR